MSRIKLPVKIENVVASGALERRIDLDAIVQAFPEAEYRGKFPGVVFKLERPSTTFLIFANGKLVCVGARSEKKVKTALRKLTRKLEEAGILIVGKPEVRIRNIVATANLGGFVDLPQLFESSGEMRGRIMYEPEQFPGVIYRMKSPKVVLLIFSTGKIVCVGAREEKDVRRAVSKLHKQLEEKRLIYH